jgi:AraC-like DNA-binding protein
MFGQIHFVHENTNYNTYINTLRISHFVSLFREAVAAGSDVTAQQLAEKSGYRSYRTFSLAFRQRKGKSVTEWISEEGG